jgi:TolA-binding protein
MKRKERHQLKENELAQTLLAAREAIERRQGQVTGIVVAIVLIGAIVFGVMAWRRQSSSRAEQLLAEAMVAYNARVIPATASPNAPGEVPAAATLGAAGSYATEAAKLTAALPKLKAAADAYPDSEAGITARYHYAGSLAALGKYDEAIKAFDEVVQRAGPTSLYGRMSRLGKADTQARAGQVDAAIATWKELAASADEELPKDAILMELAKAYQAKGNQEEARKTFNQIVDEHPSSPYTPEAKAALGS